MFDFQPADIICVRGNDFISRAVDHFEHGEYSHTAMYVGDDQIIEALLTGVELSPDTKYSDFAVFRHPKLSKEDAEKIVDYAMNRYGDRYSLEHIFTILLELTTKMNLYLAKHNATICSELDDLAYFFAGINLDKAKRVGDVDPQDVANSTELVKVYDTRVAVVH